jgi:hypothetical protein
VVRPTRIALLVLFLVALLAAGCGSSAEGVDDTTSTGEREAAPIGAQQLVAEFRQASGGTRLRGTATPDVAWEQLGLGQDPTPRQLRQYGTFTVYVVEARNDEAVTSLLSDKDTAKPLTADADGIYWDFDELSDSYVAHKRYGPNIVLAWWNESPEPGTDERFQRLDSLMEEATAG